MPGQDDGTLEGTFAALHTQYSKKKFLRDLVTCWRGNTISQVVAELVATTDLFCLSNLLRQNQSLQQPGLSCEWLVCQACAESPAWPQHATPIKTVHSR